MITVSVCIGSACHLKGSYNVINALQDLIKESKLEDQVEVKAAFCLGNCSESVAVKVNEDSIETVNSTTVYDFFKDCILTKVH